MGAVRVAARLHSANDPLRRALQTYYAGDPSGLPMPGQYLDGTPRALTYPCPVCERVPPYKHLLTVPDDARAPWCVNGCDLTGLAEWLCRQGPEPGDSPSSRPPTSEAVDFKPEPAPAPGKKGGDDEDDEGPDLHPIRALLRDCANGDIEPDYVPGMGPLPPGIHKRTRAIAEDIRLRFGLLLAEGVTRPLMYSRSEAVRGGHVRSEQLASYHLRLLESVGVIRCVGEMPKRGKGNGTKLFVPPGWRPLDPEAFAVAVETRDSQRLADLVWIPDELSLGAGGEQPGAEATDDPLVGGSAGVHDDDGIRDRGGSRGVA